MKRKIIKQGNNSYTLTLPIQWIKEHSLDGGDEIDISEDEAKLVLSVADDVKRPEVTVSFDLDGYNERTIRNILCQSYRKGFDKIIVTFRDREQLLIMKDIARDVMHGFEVTEESKNRCVIQNIAEPSSEKYSVILRKIFLVIKQESEDILDDLKKGKLTGMDKRKEIKNMIDNFTNFVRRVIINSRMGGTRNSYLLFYSTSHLSLIHHAYYYLYLFLEKQKSARLSKETISLLSKVNEMFDVYYDAFYKLDVELAHKVGIMKDRLHKKGVCELLQQKKGIENVALYYIGEIIRQIQTAATVLFGLLSTEADADQGMVA
jgi:phosphate uptake regulator